MVFSVDILYRQIGQELVQEQKSEWEEGRKEGSSVRAGDGRHSQARELERRSGSLA